MDVSQRRAVARRERACRVARVRARRRGGVAVRRRLRRQMRQSIREVGKVGHSSLKSRRRPQDRRPQLHVRCGMVDVAHARAQPPNLPRMAHEVLLEREDDRLRTRRHALWQDNLKDTLDAARRVARRWAAVGAPEPLARAEPCLVALRLARLALPPRARLGRPHGEIN